MGISLQSTKFELAVVRIESWLLIDRARISWFYPMLIRMGVRFPTKFQLPWLISTVTDGGMTATEFPNLMSGCQLPDFIVFWPIGSR
jgi:hypothetical protein